MGMAQRVVNQFHGKGGHTALKSVMRIGGVGQGLQTVNNLFESVEIVQSVGPVGAGGDGALTPAVKIRRGSGIVNALRLYKKVGW